MAGNQRTLELILKISNSASDEIKRIKAELQDTFKGINFGINKETGLGGVKNQYEETGKAAKKAGEEGQRAADESSRKSKDWQEGVAGVAFAFNQVQQTIQTTLSAGRGLYDYLIGSNEKLNAQILSTQTNLASATRIFQGGVEIQDPTEKINATRGSVEAALKQIERDSERLSGVTSEQVNQFFEASISNVTQLIGQTKKFKDPIESATALTKGWASAFSLLKIPVDQVNSEIRAILTGQELENSQIAKSLQLGKQQIEQFRSRGTLVDELSARLNTFVQGNALSSRSLGGIFSNILEVFQRVGREAGKPLLNPLIDALDKVQEYLKKNGDAIVSFFAGIATNVLDAGKQISTDFQPVFEDVIKIVQEGAPLTANLFRIIADGVVTATKLLGPLLDTLGKVIAFSVEGLNKLSELILLRQINDSVEALDNLQKSTDALSQEATNAATRFKELQAIQASGKGLTADQAKEFEALKKQLASLIPAIDAQIKTYQDLSAVTPALKPQNDANIQSLQALKTALQGTSGEFEIQGRSAQKLGTTYEQLQKRIDSNQRVIAQGFEGPELQKALQDQVKALQEAAELGTLSPEEVQERLQAIAQNASAELDTQQQAQASITKIRKGELDQQKGDVEAQIAEINAETEAGTLSQVAGAKQVTALKKKELDLQLKDVEEAIAAEEKAIAQGRGSKTKLDQLQQQQQTLNAQRIKLDAESEKQAQTAKLEAFDNAQKILDGKKAQGVVSDRQYADQSLKITKDRLAAELAEVERQRKKLSPGDKEGLAALAAKEGEIRKKQADALVAYQQQRFSIIEQAEKKATDLIKISELQRQAEVQGLINKGLLTREEAEQKKLQIAKDSLQKELAAERASTAALAALPSGKGDAEKQRQEKIRESRKRTAELTLQLAQNEQAQQEALTRVIQARIDRQLQAVKNAYTAQNQELQKQVDLQDAIGHSLDAQQKLLSARQELQRSLTDLTKTQYDQAIGLLESQFSEEDKLQQAQEKRAELQKKLAEAKTPEEKTAAQKELDALDKQEARERQLNALRIEAKQAEIEQLNQAFALEEQALQLEFEKNAALLEQEKIRLRIQQIEAKAATAQAKADVAKLQADKTAKPEQITAAQLSVEAAQAKEAGLAQQSGLVEKQGKSQADLNAVKLQTLLGQQGLKLSQAETELAKLTPSTEDDKQQFVETLNRAREARAEANQRSPQDAGLVELDQRLAGSQQELVESNTKLIDSQKKLADTFSATTTPQSNQQKFLTTDEAFAEFSRENKGVSRKDYDALVDSIGAMVDRNASRSEFEQLAVKLAQKGINPQSAGVEINLGQGKFKEEVLATLSAARTNRQAIASGSGAGAEDSINDLQLAAIQKVMQSVPLIVQPTKELGQVVAGSQGQSILQTLQKIQAAVEKTLSTQGTIGEIAINQSINGQIDPRQAADLAARQTLTGLNKALDQVRRGQAINVF